MIAPYAVRGATNKCKGLGFFFCSWCDIAYSAFFLLRLGSVSNIFSVVLTNLGIIRVWHVFLKLLIERAYVMQVGVFAEQAFEMTADRIYDNMNKGVCEICILLSLSLNVRRARMN